MLSNPLSVKAYTNTEFRFENGNALMASMKFTALHMKMKSTKWEKF
jgi:hypothetical protein